MDLGDVLNFFGGSIFIEEYRGDLLELSWALDERERSQGDPADESQRNALTILRAILHAHRGEFKHCLDKLRQLEASGNQWTFRSYIYQALLMVWADHPPMFSCWPIQDTLAYRLWFRDHTEERLLHIYNYLDEHAENQNSGCQNEWVLIKLILEGLRVCQESSQLPPTDSDSGSLDRYSELLAGLAEARENIEEIRANYLHAHFGPFHGYLQQLSYRLLHGYLQQLSYRLLHMQRSVAQNEALIALKSHYEGIDDQHGVGMYHILRGDQLISPPLLSPILRNLEPIDESWGQEDGGGVRTRENLSRKLQPASVSTLSNSTVHAAFEHYETALIYFRRSHSKRGEAVATFRRACLINLVSGSSLRLPSTMNPSILSDQLRSSRLLFGSCGDVLNEQIAHLHVTLFPERNKKIIFDPQMILAIKPQIGFHAESVGNHAFALCLGVFALQIGEQSFFRGDVNHAIYCYHTSLNIISQLSVFLHLRIQVLLKLAVIYASRGDANAATEFSGIALVLAPQLLLELRILPSGTASPESEITPLRILHLQLDPGPGIDTIVDLGMVSSYSSENKLRNTAYIYFLKEVVSSSITIDLQFAELSPPREFSQYSQNKYASIFKAISLFEGNHPAKDWLDYQKRRLEYLAVLYTSRASIQKLKPSSARASVESFLSVQPVDLMRKADMIELAVRYGNLEKAKDIMATIHDEDLVPHVATPLIPSNNSSTSPSMAHQRRALLSIELVFSSAINSRQWQRARKLMYRLEQLSPGYFASGGSPSLPAGQRLISAALVFANQESPSIAWTYAISALVEITKARIRLKLSDRGHFDNIAKATRVTNLLVHLAIRLQECGSELDMEDAQPPNGKNLPSQESILEAKRTRSMMTAFNALDLTEMVRTRTITDWVSQDRGISRNYLEITRKVRTWEHLSHRQGELDEAERQEFDLLNSEIDDLTKAEGILGAEISTQADAQPSRDLNAFLTSIQEGNLVIYTSVSDDGLAIFALDMDGIKHVSWNPDAGAPQVKMLVSDYLDILVSSKSKQLSERTRELGETLSSWLIQPVSSYLEGKDAVIFVPSGDLMRVPFGALPYKNDYLLLHKAVSQVPSLTTLFQLNLNHYRRLPKFALQKSQFCTVVAKPGSAREARKPNGEPELRMAGIEAVMISHLYQIKASHASEMSRDDFRDNLSGSEVFHLVTHGHFDPDHPLRSYISLKEKFRILDLVGLSAKPMLVIFSACLTGLGEAGDSGDMLGFSHSLLTAGATNFIGALWNASDVTTMIHMYLFHREILSTTISTVGSCWQSATKALYSMTPDDVIVLLSSWIELWDNIQKEIEYEEEFVKNGKRKIQSVIDELQTPHGRKMLDFKHPYIWAPFILVGRAGIRFTSEQVKSEVPHQDSRLVDGKPQCATQ
jgi:CHAT domain-containing protein